MGSACFLHKDEEDILAAVSRFLGVQHGFFATCLCGNEQNGRAGDPRGRRETAAGFQSTVSGLGTVGSFGDGLDLFPLM